MQVIGVSSDLTVMNNYLPQLLIAGKWWQAKKADGTRGSEHFMFYLVCITYAHMQVFTSRTVKFAVAFILTT